MWHAWQACVLCLETAQQENRPSAPHGDTRTQAATESPGGPSTYRIDRSIITRAARLSLARAAPGSPDHEPPRGRARPGVLTWSRKGIRMDSIRVIRGLSLLIMVAAMVVSYRTQRALFSEWSVDAFTASIAPIAVDLLAIICTLAVHTDGVARKGRRVAVFVLVLTGTASTVANTVAGETVGSKIVHGAMVVVYLLAEWIAAQVKSAPPVVDPRRSKAAVKAAQTRKANAAKRTRKSRSSKATTVAALEAVYKLPSAPVSPAASE